MTYADRRDPGGSDNDAKTFQGLAAVAATSVNARLTALSDSDFRVLEGLLHKGPLGRAGIHSETRASNQREHTMTTMAEPATTDLNQLDAFHALLPALAGALDIRDVFQQLSAVASRIVPHDEANLAVATDDGTQYRLYASTREGAPEVVCRDDHGVLRGPMAARLIESVPWAERRRRS